jgi:hypothetical protein
MSDQNKRGRPLKRNGRKLIKFYADNDDAAYLDAVKAARGLPSVAEAGRLVLSDAHAQRRFAETDEEVDELVDIQRRLARIRRRYQERRRTP